MNDPIQALAQMAMNRISSDPNFQRNPQAKAFMDIMQRGHPECHYSDGYCEHAGYQFPLSAAR